jgi:hypothetical protein
LCRRASNASRRVRGSLTRNGGSRFNAQTDDDFPYLLKYAGNDNIVIGTDYGHTDAPCEVDAIEVFQGNHEVSDAVKKKILANNPRVLVRPINRQEVTRTEGKRIIDRIMFGPRSGYDQVLFVRRRLAFDRDARTRSR